MLLQRLVEYSRRDPELLPPGFSNERVRYWIELDSTGKMLGVVTTVDEAGRATRAPVPTLVRSSSIKPKLLADNGEYVLGVGKPDAKPGRVSEAHRLFLDLTRRCADATHDPAVEAVLRFLHSLPNTPPALPPDFDPAGVISFIVDGLRPVDLTSVRSFWLQQTGEGELMQCLVCGQQRPAMERIQLRLKGIPNGQTSGLALISANADAFESHGLKASYVAPICQECSDRSMKALGSLIAEDRTHLRLDDVVYVFWTRQETTYSWAGILSSPEPEDVKALLESPFRARPAALDPEPFYAAALSASGARAVVRDWIDTTVATAQTNLRNYFRAQALPDVWGQPGRPLGIWRLGKATVRSNSTQRAAPWVFPALVRHALAGTPLPASLLFKAVERCRAEPGGARRGEERVSRTRAVLIKMVLLSRGFASGGADLSTLDNGNRDPAYLCGRLFAELEQTQRSALGDVGATIVDRYYGTASSAPATVFGQILRGSQPHLAKLRRDRHGTYVALDRALQDILAGLDRFPTTLNLQQQGLFALGYYHQRAHNRHAALEHRQTTSTVQEA
jgi:CRISPR-associated protein Csd1